MQLIQSNCGGTIIRSNNAYSSGYAEAVIQLGGQGSNYAGLVNTFILQSDPSQVNPDEVDYEVLGKNVGEVQTNIYVNGSPVGVNYKGFTGFEMVSQSVKFGLRWKFDLIEWYINDVLVRSKSNPGFSKPMYIWSSIWDGSSTASSWAGTTNWATGPTQNYYIKVDYIKYCNF